MERAGYNPQKAGLQTVDVVFSDENMTWFDHGTQGHDVYMITDFEGGLPIREFGYA